MTTVLWFLIPALAVVLVAAAGVRLAVSRASERTSRLQIAEIEGEAGPDDGDEFVLVRGKLVVDSQGCKPPEGGRPETKKCAATATWSSERRLVRKNGEHLTGERAERLMIEASDGLVELRGPLEVAMGSRLIVGGEPVPAGLTRRFMSRTALFEGDEVVAVGIRQRDPERAHDGAGQYRAPAGVAVLVPEKDMLLPIAAARLSRTTVSVGALFSSRAMLSAFVVALAAGSFMAYQSHTPFSPGCRDSGRCNWLFHSTNDADCRAAFVCLKRGLCDSEQGHCVAQSEADCHLSIDCVDHGSCYLSGDVCTHTLVPSELDCARDEWLEERGDAHCGRSSGGCSGSSSGGACTEWLEPSSTRPRQCVARECAASCSETGMCRIYGLCAGSVERGCVATEEGCASSERCRQHGACSVDGHRCAADMKGTDCARSEACAKHGWCLPTAFENGEDHYHHVCFSHELPSGSH